MCIMTYRAGCARNHLDHPTKVWEDISKRAFVGENISCSPFGEQRITQGLPLFASRYPMVPFDEIKSGSHVPDSDVMPERAQ